MNPRASRSPKPVELRLPPQPDSVSAARNEVAEFVERVGAQSDDAALAVTEAVANAVEHGFRGSGEGTIVVRIETLVPDTLAVTVSDDGVGISPNPDRTGLGLGLALIGKLSNELEIRSTPPHGTRVHMRFPLTQRPVRAERDAASAS
jgi:anti-sigma regulatory factor (Ser/Thr protein kinase)